MSKDRPTSESIESVEPALIPNVLCNAAGIPERVETERLIIRLWEPNDAEAAQTAVTASIEHLRPWMPWIAAEPLSVDDRRALIAQWRTQWEEGGEAVYGIFTKPTAGRGETVAGGTGLHRRVGPDGLEIGYWVGIDHVRQGYALEASAALTSTALAIDGINRVQIHHDKANVASAGVPSKLGYTLVREEPREPMAPAEIGIMCIWQFSG